MAAMDNFNRPAGGDPRDHQPTEQFWPAPGVPPGGPGPGNDYPWQQAGPQAHPASNRSKTRRWTVGIALAALLAGGGVIAGASLASTTLSSAPTASTGTSGSGTAGSTGGGAAAQGGGSAPAGQAALLDATLNAAGAPDAAVTTSAGGPPASGTGGAATAPAARRCAQLARTARAARRSGHPRLSGAARAATARCRFIRRRIVRFFLLRGVDGQFSFTAADGTVRTLAYVRGVIESVSNGTSIVVKAADGSSWAWQLVSTTVVRDSSGKISQSTLAVGEPVWVGGPVVSGAKDARLIFVRPPGG
jgi:hypothetical protein